MLYPAQRGRVLYHMVSCDHNIETAAGTNPLVSQKATLKKSPQNIESQNGREIKLSKRDLIARWPDAPPIKLLLLMLYFSDMVNSISAVFLTNGAKEASSPDGLWPS